MFKKTISEYNGLSPQDPFSSLILQRIILLTAVMSILTSFLQSINWQFTNGLHLEEWLGLSLHGISHYFFWQPVTYLFLDGASLPFSALFLLSLALNLYVLWIVGKQVVEHIGNIAFLRVYFSLGIAAAINIIGFLWLTNSDYPVTGNIAPLYGLLTIWCMISPENEISLLPNVSLKTKWLCVSLVGVQILLSFVVSNMPQIIAVFTGVTLAYFYSICSLGLAGPFYFTMRFENVIRSRYYRFVNTWQMKYVDELPLEEKMAKTKIYDFKTGRAVMDDDEFMDSMLEKISQQGEKALTRDERNRMTEISMRKSHDRSSQE
jgi:membrane associated rhomboid family serine protease